MRSSRAAAPERRGAYEHVGTGGDTGQDWPLRGMGIPIAHNGVLGGITGHGASRLDQKRGTPEVVLIRKKRRSLTEDTEAGAAAPGALNGPEIMIFLSLLSQAIQGLGQEGAQRNANHEDTCPIVE